MLRLLDLLFPEFSNSRPYLAFQGWVALAVVMFLPITIAATWMLFAECKPLGVLVGALAVLFIPPCFFHHRQPRVHISDDFVVTGIDGTRPDWRFVRSAVGSTLTFLLLTGAFMMAIGDHL